MIESMKNDFEKRFQSPDGKKMHLEMEFISWIITRFFSIILRRKQT